MRESIRKYLKVTLLMCAGSLAACQSVGTVIINDGDSYNYASFEAQRINLYHNVHYNNPGFYPRGSYSIGGYYWMRGYRY